MITLLALALSCDALHIDHDARLLTCIVNGEPVLTVDAGMRPVTIDHEAPAVTVDADQIARDGFE